MVWLSGPPGSGKSTTGMLMGRENGYVCWDADCTMNGLNPFIPLNSENATLAVMRQPALKVIIVISLIVECDYSNNFASIKSLNNFA